MSDGQGQPREYTGRILWHAELKCWGAPSGDIAPHIGRTEGNFITSLDCTRVGLDKPNTTRLWQPAPEYVGDRKPKKVPPYLVFLDGVNYLISAQRKKYPGLQDVAAALARKEAECPPPKDPPQAGAPGPEPAGETAGSWLVYNNRPIHDQAEMLNLTDMWRADGEDPEKRPDYWKKDRRHRHFLDGLQQKLNAPVECIWFGERGSGGATWAHWQIALAYAMWLSPEFHMACNDVVRNHMEGKASGALPADLPDIIAAAVATQLQPVLIKLGVIESQNVTMADLLVQVTQLKTGRRTTWSELGSLIEHRSHIGAAKAINVGLNNYTPVVGNIAQTAVWSAAEALQHGTVDQKIAERKAKRNARRGRSDEPPPAADDDPGFDFDFDA